MPLTIQDLIKAVEKAKIYVPTVFYDEDGAVHVPHIVDADILLAELKKMEE